MIRRSPSATTQARDRLEDAGWYVIRVRYDDDWNDLAGANPTVFGAGR
jgi:hypothetical protein